MSREESILLVIDTLIDSRYRAIHYPDQAVGKLESAKRMIDEIIEEIENE